jgi:hypothetical protein
MVLDAKLFVPGRAVAPGTFLVVEQAHCHPK